MATQDEAGVPFSIAHDLQQFRLLELPQEIVELIDAPNPPLLSIKSQPPSTTSGTPNPKAAYAVLCTPSKTFQLRQVATSNSLFVTQPALEGHGNEIPAPTVRAIASCTTTLELHASDGASTVYLEDVLPVYDIVDDEVDAAGNGKSKTDIFQHIPLSEGQCEQGWRDLMAFEFGGSSYRPSANTLAQVWKCANAVALAEGVKFDKQFLIEDITRAVAEERYPPTLALAIIRRLATDDQDAEGGWSCLDRRKVVHFVGQTLLEARRGVPDYLIAHFLDTWKDSVPEAWRGDAELTAIDGAYDLPNPTTIRLRGATATAKPEGSVSKGSSSRKWHEKLGRARRK